MRAPAVQGGAARCREALYACTWRAWMYAQDRRRELVKACLYLARMESEVDTEGRRVNF